MIEPNDLHRQYREECGESPTYWDENSDGDKFEVYSERYVLWLEKRLLSLSEPVELITPIFSKPDREKLQVEISSGYHLLDSLLRHGASGDKLITVAAGHARTEFMIHTDEVSRKGE